MKRLRLFLTILGQNTVNFPGTTPPLGILYLAAYLRDRFNVEIRLLDQRAENCSEDMLARQIIDFEPDVVGICLLTSYAYMLPTLTQAIRAGRPNALIVLGGPHASSFGTAALDGTSADLAVIGEGERPFEAILSAYLDGSDYAHIPGLIRRDSAGEIVANPGSIPVIEDLDSLPFPAYDLLDMPKYWNDISIGTLPPHRYVSLFSSRGCPRQCTYCHSIFGKRFRPHSAERIVAEVEHYVKTYGIKEIEFLDDSFNSDNHRVLEFVDLLNKKGIKLKIGFPNGLQCHTLNDETLDALVGAGLYHTCLALESGSPRIQKLIGKHLHIPKFTWSVEAAAKRGVLTNGLNMMGFPTETEEDIQATIDVACQSRLHTASFFTVLPFPNTVIYNQLLETHPEKLKQIQYAQADYAGGTVNFSDVPDSVFFAMQRKALRRFYLNPKRVARILRSFPDLWFLGKLVPMYLIRTSKKVFAHQ